MSAKRVEAAARVIHAEMEQGRQSAGSFAAALESARLLMSPEVAAELERLRSEVESSRVDGWRLIRAEQRRAELEAVLGTHRKDDQAEIERLRARVAELEAKPLVDRERVELLAGFERALSPFCSDPKSAAAAVASVRDPEVEWLLRDAQRLQDRVIELEALTPAPIQTCRVCGAGYTYGQPCSTCEFRARMAAEGYDASGASVEAVTSRWSRFFAPTQAYREEALAEEPALTVFRASHDSIVMGLYTTAAAARAHCEAEERRSWAAFEKPTFDWIEDEEDGVAEMTAWVGNEACATGYEVTALEIASAYDEDGDE